MDFLLEFISPQKRVDSSEVERVRAAIAFCMFACTMATLSLILAFVNGGNFDGVFVLVLFFILFYAAMTWAHKYTTYTMAATYFLAGSIAVLSVLMYANQQSIAGSNGVHDIGFLLCSPTVAALILPAQMALIFNAVTLLFTVAAVFIIDSQLGHSGSAEAVLMVMFLYGIIGGVCIVRYTQTTRIESQKRRLQFFLDASLTGMAVVDVSGRDEPVRNKKDVEAGSRSSGGRGSPSDSAGSRSSRRRSSPPLPGDSLDDTLSPEEWTEFVLENAIIDHNVAFTHMFGVNAESGVSGKCLRDYVTITGQLGPSMVSAGRNDASASGTTILSQSASQPQPPPTEKLDFSETNNDSEFEMVTTVYEAYARRDDGSQFECEVAVHKFRSSKEHIGAVALRDVSERVKIQKAKRRSEVEQKTTAERAEFLDTISHELRNPIHAIVGMTDIVVAQAGELPGALRSHIQTIASTSHTLLAIVNQILDFSRINAEGIELAPEPTGLVAFVESLVTEVDVMARSKGLVVSYDYDKRLDNVFLVDSLRLSQVLRNFTTNAIKYTDKGGVGIVAKYKSETSTHTTMLFEVHDTGTGIELEDQRVIFGKFKMLKGSNTGGFASSGLGLAIAAKLVDALGGAITVSSVPGVGSTFGVTVALQKYGAPGTSYSLPSLLSRVSVIVFERVTLIRELQASHLRGEGAAVQAFGEFASMVSYIRSLPACPNGIVSLSPLTSAELKSLSVALKKCAKGVPNGRNGKSYRCVVVSTVAPGSGAPPVESLAEIMHVVRTAATPLNETLVNAFVRRSFFLAPAPANLEESFAGTAKLSSTTSSSRAASELLGAEASVTSSCGGRGDGGGGGGVRFETQAAVTVGSVGSGATTVTTLTTSAASGVTTVVSGGDDGGTGSGRASTAGGSGGTYSSLHRSPFAVEAGAGARFGMGVGASASAGSSAGVGAGAGAEVAPAIYSSAALGRSLDRSSLDRSRLGNSAGLAATRLNTSDNSLHGSQSAVAELSAELYGIAEEAGGETSEGDGGRVGKGVRGAAGGAGGGGGAVGEGGLAGIVAPLTHPSPAHLECPMPRSSPRSSNTGGESGSGYSSEVVASGGGGTTRGPTARSGSRSQSGSRSEYSEKGGVSSSSRGTWQRRHRGEHRGERHGGFKNAAVGGDGDSDSDSESSVLLLSETFDRSLESSLTSFAGSLRGSLSSLSPHGGGRVL